MKFVGFWGEQVLAKKVHGMSKMSKKENEIKTTKGMHAMWLRMGFDMA